MKKIPPKKPHFFKPILPGFKNDLKIPVGFLKYLKGHENVHAILRRGGKKWLVKVNGRRMEDGWTKFAEEHDLQLGDMLVLRHEGNMEFDVSIFGSSLCEKKYMQEDEDEEEETPKKFDLEEAANKDMHLTHSHFICTIRPYCLSRNFVAIPRQFALKNRLNNRKCMIIIRDERRSKTFSLYTSGGITYIGNGWREFCIDKCLKEGDRIMFEIISNGETPVFEFQDLRGSPSVHPDEAKKKNLHVNRIKTTDATAPKKTTHMVTPPNDPSNSDQGDPRCSTASRCCPPARRPAWTTTTSSRFRPASVHRPPASFVAQRPSSPPPLSSKPSLPVSAPARP